jgi:DNA-binding MarR family transcriptional regulator
VTPAALRGRPGEQSAEELAAVQLVEAVARLVRRLRRAYAGPLSVGSFSALASVVRLGRVRLGDLAEREGVAPPTLSRVVAQLEREGYVERQVDEEDRRSAFLVPSELGRRTFEDVYSRRAATLVERMAGLSDADRAAVLAAVPAIERLAAD